MTRSPIELFWTANHHMTGSSNEQTILKQKILNQHKIQLHPNLIFSIVTLAIGAESVVFGKGAAVVCDFDEKRNICQVY